MTEKRAAETYSREQLKSSRRYAGKADLLGVLLSGERKYTLEEADKTIQSFMKRRVG